jgi:uncharacterized protein
MANESNAGVGRFVWYDLMTPDVEASLDFYSKLFGWGSHVVDMGPMGQYTMIRNGGSEIGGIAPLGPGEGDKAYWLSYVSVADVDQAASQAEGKGGAVLVPPTDIPETGRFAIVKDPAGARIAPFRGQNPPPGPQGPPPAGSFCWNELTTSDAGKAKDFYSTVFGWSAADMDLGEMGPYTLFKRGDQDAAGMSQSADQPPSWLPYVAVADVDASAARAGELGGATYVPPTDIPNIGRFAVIGDPAGGTIALFKPAA